MKHKIVWPNMLGMLAIVVIGHIIGALLDRLGMPSRPIYFDVGFLTACTMCLWINSHPVCKVVRIDQTGRTGDTEHIDH